MNIKLRNFRINTGLSQEKFALKLKVSYSYYCKVERGLCKASKSFLDKFKLCYPNESIDNIFFTD